LSDLLFGKYFAGIELVSYNCYKLTKIGLTIINKRVYLAFL